MRGAAWLLILLWFRGGLPGSATLHLGPLQGLTQGGAHGELPRSQAGNGAHRRLQQVIDPATPGWHLYSKKDPIRLLESNVAFVEISFLYTYQLTTSGAISYVSNVEARDASFRPVEDAASTFLTVSASDFHVLGVLPQGEAYGWRDDSEGQIDIPPQAKANVQQVAAGGAHSLALLASGEVVAWGSDYDGQATVPPDVNTVGATQVDAGDVHSCALLKTGAVRCWGSNSFNQSTVPAAAQSGVTRIACGYERTLALKQDGSLLVWGDTRQQPASLTGPFKTISAGGGVAAAVLTNGTVFVWGNAQAFLEGWIIPNLAGVEAVVVFGDLVAAHVGPMPSVNVPPGPPIPALPAPQPPPVELRPDQSAVRETSTGGRLVLWGNNLAATSDSPLVDSSNPVLPPVVSVCSGRDYSLALLPNGTVKLLWSGAQPAVKSVPPAALSDVKKLSCGSDHALAVVGNRGNLVLISEPAPNPINIPDSLKQGGVKDVAAGYDGLSLVLMVGGAVIAFPNGIVTVPPEARSNVTAIAAGYEQGLALLNSGKVVSITPQATLDVFGDTFVPQAATSNIKAIACGSDHSVALTENGTVVAWGRNAFGATSPPKDLPPVAAIAAGPAYTMVLTQQGRVEAFGALGMPIMFPNAVASGVTAIAPGFNHILAVLGPLASMGDPIPVIASAAPRSIPSGPDFSQATNPSDSSKNGLGVGAIAGIVGGVSGAAILTGVLFAFLWKRRKDRGYQATSASDIENQLMKGAAKKKEAGKDGAIQLVMAPGEDNDFDSADGQVAIVVAGLLPGDPFLKATSKQYRWAPVGSLTQDAVPIEADVSDTQLDLALTGNRAPPVHVLSAQEVFDELELLPDGLLGRGAAAYVFKARWPKRFGPNGLVAVKLLKDAYRCDVNILQSFNHEARLLESVRHPNVVRIYGYCLEPPTVCLILELLPVNLNDKLYPGKASSTTSQFARPGTTIPATSQDGSTIGSTTIPETPAGSTNPGSFTGITQEATPVGANMGPSPFALVSNSTAPQQDPQLSPPLSMLEVLLLSRDIAAGLAYLHDKHDVGKPDVPGAGPTIAEEEAEAEGQAALGPANRIVHRDLKPANILLNSKGIAKISDFGLGREHETTTVYTEHVGAGTLAYMAPELLRGRKGSRSEKPTNRVDIYSLAVMMHEMVARQKPWATLNEMQLMLAVCSKRRPPLPPRPAVPPEVPSNLALVPANFDVLPSFNDVISACWHNRELRRPTATEVLNMLDGILVKVGVPNAAATPRDKVRLPAGVLPAQARPGQPAGSATAGSSGGGSEPESE